MDLEELLRRERREARIADFVMSTVISCQPPGGGVAVPEDETVRELVRAARVVFSEIDHPTSPEEQREAPSGGARQEHPVDDWREGLWTDESEPAPEP